MKYSYIILFFLLFSCSAHYTKLENKKPFNSKGFAYIYNEHDFKNKIIKTKLNNEIYQIAQKNLPIGTLIKVINPKTNQSITLKNQKKGRYPEFYKILISEAVAKKLNISNDLPIIEIIEVKKNKSFIAKKAKIFNEEKKISSNAPVTSVEISNISQNKKVKKLAKEKVSILIASFYSVESAEFLRQRIIKEIPNFDNKKIKINKKNNKEINLISGPYKSVNLMKNDYIQLKKFGFEELDIILN